MSTLRPEAKRQSLRRLRMVLGGFMVGLVLSGVTAFPLEWELDLLCRWLGIPPGAAPGEFSGLAFWLATVRQGLHATYAQYPFMAYGTDWLAFGHIVIAIAFVGAWRDPVRNIWLFDFGLIACALIIPVVLVCGPLRGIPPYWQLLDCSFGLVAALPLWWCR